MFLSTLTTVTALVLFVGQFFLQYFFSTRQAKWPGFIQIGRASCRERV